MGNKVEVRKCCYICGNFCHVKREDGGWEYHCSALIETIDNDNIANEPECDDFLIKDWLIGEENSYPGVL